MSQVNKPAPCTQHAPRSQENQLHRAVAAVKSWFPDVPKLVRSVGGSIKSAIVSPAEAHGDRMVTAADRTAQGMVTAAEAHGDRLVTSGDRIVIAAGLGAGILAAAYVFTHRAPMLRNRLFAARCSRRWSRQPTRPARGAADVNNSNTAAIAAERGSPRPTVGIVHQDTHHNTASTRGHASH